MVPHEMRGRGFQHLVKHSPSKSVRADCVARPWSLLLIPPTRLLKHLVKDDFVRKPDALEH